MAPDSTAEFTRAVRAVRNSVALSQLDHVSIVRASGDGAFRGVNRIFPRELYVRDGQLAQGVLLDEGGAVWADCLLGNDEGDYIFICEGRSADDVAAYIRDHCQDVEDLEISIPEGVSAVGIDGPYAWELLALLVGPEVIGLPYLTFFHFDGVLCCRSGKTGEYGYVLVADAGELVPLRNELMELGTVLDVAEGGVEALDACALENGFFNIRREGGRALTPLELQLQWRISRRKSYVGSEALERRRGGGLRQRVTHVVSEGLMTLGDAVTRDGESCGTLVNAGYSVIRGDWVGLALLDLPYALPGVDALEMGDGRASARSVSPPVINNRSLYVNPQVHSYASRHGDDFPPLVGS